MKALLALALLAPTTQTAAPPCISPAEMKHATLFLLPPILDGLAEQCRASLPAGAYLLTAGAERSRQLAADRAAHWDGARAALIRLTGEQKASAFSGDTAALLIRDVIKAEGGKKMQAGDCATLDRALSLLAPLPPENVAELVALAAEVGMRADAEKAAKAGKAKDGKPARSMPLTICPAPMAAR